MGYLAEFILLLSCLTISTLAERRTLGGMQYDVYGDIFVPVNKDRSLYELGLKYPEVDGFPTYYYAIDKEKPNSRQNLRETLDTIEEITCFKFIEIDQEDPRSKIVYIRDDGCGSSLGYWGINKQYISIGDGCDFMATIAHETMHALGFPHTQSEPTRDDAIKVLYENVDSKVTWVYDIEWFTETRGTVFDFGSVMLYIQTAFANSKKPTYITLDPSHERYIDQFPTMRYPEAYLLNRHYNCTPRMGLNCTNKTECLNGGFYINSCKCFCPSNFTGPMCETFAGPWFKPLDEDKKYTEPGVYVTNGYPFENPKESVLSWFVIPRCFRPRIKIISEDLVEEYWDETSVRKDLNYPWINLYEYETGDYLDGNGTELIVKHENRHEKPGRGVEFAVEYVLNGTCKDDIADFSKLFCHKQKTPNGSWVYETPQYPEVTHKGMACKLPDTMDETKLQSLLVTFDYNLKAGERLDITHGHLGTFQLVGPARSKLVFPSTYPTTFSYKASEIDPGYFSYKANTVYVPEMCGVITDISTSLTVPNPFTRRYPKCLYPNGVMCNMLFRAAVGKKLSISFQLPVLKANVNESLIIYTDYKNRAATSYVITKQSNPITINSNMMLVTYRFMGTPPFSDWTFNITPV